MVGIEVHYVFPYIEERVCVGLRKIFPLNMEVYFCDFVCLLSTHSGHSNC